MRKITLEFQSLPTNLPVKVEICIMEKLYSEVKLQKTFIDGKPAIIPNKGWYIYYYFRNPVTKKMQKFMKTCKINHYQDIKERTKWGEAWVKATELLLSTGFNPFLPNGNDEQKDDLFLEKVYTITEALNYAFDNKIGEWKDSTISDYKTRKTIFIEWLKSNKIDRILVKEFTEKHFVAFMNWLISPAPNGRGVGKTSQDNYKRCMSSLFGKLVKDKIISETPVNYKTSKNEPVKNTPFTIEQLIEIKRYLLAHDVQLYHFLLHVIYSFLRNREIIRLRAGDIRIKDKILQVETKTSSKAIVRLIGPVIDFYEQINISTIPKKANIFTNTGICEVWVATEKAKVDHFAHRFNKVKTALGYGDEYGIYSARHTAAINVYNSFIKDLSHREAVLKLMPIIRHKNESTTEQYLRDVMQMLPKDYGEFYTLNF